MKAVPKGSINLDQSITKLGRGVSLGPEDSYQREGLEEANHTLRSISKDERRTNLNITARDRDVIITRIAQFYDSHSQGTDALVSDLLRMFNDLQLKEQSLGLRHHELNEEVCYFIFLL